MKSKDNPFLLVGVVLLLLAFSGRAQWAGVDPEFPVGTGPENSVQCLAMQRDGRLLVGGCFTNFSGAAHPFLARLDTNGSVDSTFNPHPDDFVTQVVVQADGRLLISGLFTEVNGVSYQQFCRLLADGTSDTNFVPPKAQGSGSIGSVAAGHDGAVWVGGTFTNLGGLPCNHVARLLEQGSIDPAFHSPFGADDSASVLAVLPDGKALVSGLFTNVGVGVVTNLVRLNIDGSVDSTFRSGLLPTERALKALALPDGRLLLTVAAPIGYLWITEARLVRLNADGSVDSSFQVSFEFPSFQWNYSVSALERQPDGRILVAGTFLRVNGQSRGRIARLMPDGTLDYTFDVKLGDELAPRALAVDGEGGVIVGGFFSGLQGQVHPNLLRLLPGKGCEPGVIEMMTPALLSRREESAAVVPVARHGGADVEQTVEFFTRDGSARAGVDYEAVSGTVLFGCGQQSQCIRVPLKPGTRKDAATFEVILRQAGNGAILGSLTNVVVTLTNSRSGSAGAPDTNYLVQLDGPVQAIIPLDGGRALIAGAFTNVNGHACPNLARLQADGTRDPGFVRTNALDGYVRAVALDAAGRVLVAGDFTHVDGVLRPSLARFLSDGTLDSSFRPFDGWPTNEKCEEMDAVAVLTDGSIVCAGMFDDALYGYRDALLKFRSDGTLDSAFASNTARFDINVTGLKALPNGGFLEIGPGLGASMVNLNSDGTINLGFIPPADRQFGYRAGVDILSDGRVVVGAMPDAYSGLLSLPPVWRLAADGVEDASFSASLPSGASMSVSALSASEDGQVVVAGSYWDSNTDFYGVQRFCADGSLDGSFDCGTGVTTPDNGSVSVNALKPLSTGGWLLGGDFSAYDGFNQSYLVKLLPESLARPQTFSFTVTNLSFAKTNCTFDLEIRRRGDASQAASVALVTLEGTAKAGLDYQAINTNLLFGAGEWNKTVAVTLVDDRLADGDKQFTVSLTNAAGGFSIVSPATVTVSMVEQDAGVEFLCDEFHGRVEDGYVMIGVRWFGKLSGAPPAQVNITPITGHAQDLGISTAAVFPGYTNWFRIPIADTARHEATRQFRLQLVGGGNVIPGARAVATLSIDDSNFSTAPARGVAGVVEAVADSRDGGVYLAGDFMGVHGVSRCNIARLLPNGEVDDSFDPGDGPNAHVTAIAEQPDGKVIIAGDFTAVCNVPRAGVARLNKEGSVDLTFDPGLGAQPSNGFCVIHVVLPQSDGTIYMAGKFSQFNNSSNRALVRLQSDGAVDRQFTSPFCLGKVWRYPILNTNRFIVRPIPSTGDADPIPIYPAPAFIDSNVVYGLAVQPDGKLVVAGTLLTTTSSTYTLVRLDQNGQVDATFTNGVSTAESVALTGDGSILVGGLASKAYADCWVPISRLRTNGTSDAQFQVRNVPLLSFTYMQSEVRQMLHQRDGRILFIAAIHRFESQTNPFVFDRTIIGRLLPDGQWDDSFSALTCAMPLMQQSGPFWFQGLRSDARNLGMQPYVPTANLALQPNGVLVLGGVFDLVNNEPRRRLARVDLDGSLRGRLLLRLSSNSPMQLQLPGEVEFPYVIETSIDLVSWSECLIDDYPWWSVDLSLPRDEPARFFRTRPLQ